MTRFKRNLWMSTVMGGALALAAVPALASPGQDAQTGARTMEHPASMGMSAHQGVSSSGKLQPGDAHALWLLHQINQTEISQAQLALSKTQNDKVKDLAGELRDDHQKLDEDVMKLVKDNNVQFAGEMTGTGGSGELGTEAGTGGAGAQGSAGMSTTGDQTGAATGTESTGGGSSTIEEIPNHGGTGGSGTMTGAGAAHSAGQAGLSAADRSLLASGAAQLQHLQGLQGAELDRAFLEAQVKDHQKALSMLRGVSAQNDDVKGLLDEAIPKLEKHEKDSQDALKSLRGVGGSGDEGNGMSDPGQTQEQSPDQEAPSSTP